jgi:hypothetical protein
MKTLSQDSWETVFTQIATVRASGKVNLLDIPGTQRVANELECHALVIVCQDLLEERNRHNRGMIWTELINSALSTTDGFLPRAVIEYRLSQVASWLAYTATHENDKLLHQGAMYAKLAEILLKDGVDGLTSEKVVMG